MCMKKCNFFHSIFITYIRHASKFLKTKSNGQFRNEIENEVNDYEIKLCGEEQSRLADINILRHELSTTQTTFNTHYI